MSQRELIARLREADHDIDVAQVRTKEALGRLRAARARRDELRKGCTHRLEDGKSALESGMFGDVCRLCDWKDF